MSAVKLLLSAFSILQSFSVANVVILNTEITEQNGAILMANPESVTIQNNQYHVTVSHQDAYDLKLSLNNNVWSFHPTNCSSFTLEINGSTPIHSSDADFLIVFAVGNHQYFSYFVHLDVTSIKSRIYPSLAIERGTISVSSWISDTLTIPQRWDRISNNGQWIITSNWRSQAQWPLKFIITNDPINKQSLFQFYHILLQFAMDYKFGAAFRQSRNRYLYHG